MLIQSSQGIVYNSQGGGGELMYPGMTEQIQKTWSPYTVDIGFAREGAFDKHNNMTNPGEPYINSSPRCTV